jgi:hypothetical protein
VASLLADFYATSFNVCQARLYEPADPRIGTFTCE